MLTMLAALTIALQAGVDTPGPETGSWIEISRTGEMRLELDETATRREGDRVRVRLRADLSGEPGEARWGIAEMEFTCGAWTARGIALSEYDANGRLLRRISDAEAAGAFAGPPGEDARRFMEATCHRTGWGEEGEE
jgi:hypothetical protein